MDTPVDTQYLDVRGFVCVFVGFHALFCSNSEKYSGSGGELSLQRRTGMGGAHLTPPGGLQAVLWFLAGQSLQIGQQALGSVPSWRAWRPAEDSGQERRPLRAGLSPTVGLLGDWTRSSLRTLWGHLISILDTLSSIEKIPKGWKLCQGLGQTMYSVHYFAVCVALPMTASDDLRNSMFTIRLSHCTVSAMQTGVWLLLFRCVL